MSEYARYTAEASREERMQKDFSSEVDAAVPAAEKLAKSNKLTEALEPLYTLEKQTRSASDLESNRRLLKLILQLIFNAKKYDLLNENIVALSKKHGLLKTAVTAMIQQAVGYIGEITDSKAKLELIDTLRTVTEDKIFVEIERARVTKILSKIKEDEDKINEAADILQQLPVETFGSMEKAEKIDFILEQMRLTLAKGDYTRTQIISKKINTRSFRDADQAEYKLRYYDLLIKYFTHEEKYLDACKSYFQIYETPSIAESEEKALDVLKYIVIFVALAPFDNEQSDLLYRIQKDEKLNKIPLFQKFLECFINDSLVRWVAIEKDFSQSLASTGVFDQATEDGKKRWAELHKRVVEHNIRVIAKFYDRITLKRLDELLDLERSKTEEFLANLVTKKTVYAKIDRPSGIVTFQATKDPNTILNEWSSNVNQLLGLIVKTTHLITKEEMVHSTGLSKSIHKQLK